MIKLANKIALASLLGAEEEMEKSAAVKMLRRLRPFGDYYPIGRTSKPLYLSEAENIDSYIKGGKLPGSLIQPETRNILAKGSGRFQPYLKIFADDVMNRLTAERISKMLVDRYNFRHETDDLLKRDTVNKLKDIQHRRFMQAAAKGTPEAWRRYGRAGAITDILEEAPSYL